MTAMDVEASGEGIWEGEGLPIRGNRGCQCMCGCVWGKWEEMKRSDQKGFRYLNKEFRLHSLDVEAQYSKTCVLK